MCYTDENILKNEWHQKMGIRQKSAREWREGKENFQYRTISINDIKIFISRLRMGKNP